MSSIRPLKVVLAALCAAMIGVVTMPPRGASATMRSGYIVASS